MMVMYMFYASFSFLFTMITHYTGTKQSGSAFYLFSVVKKTVRATNKNIKFYCALRPEPSLFFSNYPSALSVLKIMHRCTE